MKKTRILVALLLVFCMMLALSAVAFADDKPEIVLNLDGEPATLCTMNQGASTSTLAIEIAYGRLFRILADDSVYLEFAESYDLDVDNLMLTVKLRDGLMFADGSPLTANDVLLSFYLTENFTGGSTGDVDFDRTRVVDDTTIEIGLRNYSFGLLRDLANIGIVSCAWTEDGANLERITSDVLCSGPYMLEPWTTGNPLVLVPNPYYYNADAVRYSKITIKCIADETTRFLDYQNGGVDVCLISDPANVDSMDAGFAPGILNVTDSQSVQGVVFDTGYSDTFKNQNLRLALCYATDTQTLVEAYCGKYYSVADSSFPASTKYHYSVPYEFDVDKAIEYLNKYYEETGTDSVEFTLLVMAGTMADTLAEALQYQWQSELPGVKMNINSVDVATFFGTAMGGVIDGSVGAITMGYYDPTAHMSAWRSEGIMNFMHINDNPELNGLLEDIFTNVDFVDDPDARLQACFDLQQGLHDYGKMIPIYENCYFWCLNSDYVTPDNMYVNGGGFMGIEFCTDLG